MFKKLLLMLFILPSLALANQETEQNQNVMHNFPYKPGMPPFPPGFLKDGQLPPYLHGLDLSEQQKTAINAILTVEKPKLDAKFETGRQFFAEMHKLVFSDNYSEEKMQAMIEKSISSHRQIGMAISKVDHAIYGLLTTQQKAEIAIKFNSDNCFGGMEGHKQ